MKDLGEELTSLGWGFQLLFCLRCAVLVACVLGQEIVSRHLESFCVAFYFFFLL